eukprot:768351-Hanusia_phi.AAC.6
MINIIKNATEKIRHFEQYMISRDQYVQSLRETNEKLEEISNSGQVEHEEPDDSKDRDVLTYLYENLRRQHANLLSVNEELEAMYSSAKEEAEQQSLLIFALNQELKDTRKQHLNSTIKLTQKMVTCENARSWATNSFNSTSEKLMEAQRTIKEQNIALEQMMMANAKLHQKLYQQSSKSWSSLDFLKKTYEVEPLTQDLKLEAFDSETLRSLVQKVIHQRKIEQEAIFFFLRENEEEDRGVDSDVSRKIECQPLSHKDESLSKPSAGLKVEPEQSLLETLLDSFSKFFKDSRGQTSELSLADASDPCGPVPLGQGHRGDIRQIEHFSGAYGRVNKLTKIVEEDEEEGLSVSFDETSAGGSVGISSKSPCKQRKRTCHYDAITASSTSQRSWMIML